MDGGSMVARSTPQLNRVTPAHDPRPDSRVVPPAITATLLMGRSRACEELPCACLQVGSSAEGRAAFLGLPTLERDEISHFALRLDTGANDSRWWVCK